MTEIKFLKYETSLTRLLKVKFSGFLSRFGLYCIIFYLAEFSEMYLTSDWPSVRQAFIRKYASSFTENKKRDLNMDFNEQIRRSKTKKLVIVYYSAILESNGDGSC